MRFEYWIEQRDDPEMVVQERLTAIASQLERIADAIEDGEGGEW